MLLSYCGSAFDWHMPKHMSHQELLSIKIRFLHTRFSPSAGRIERKAREVLAEFTYANLTVSILCRTGCQAKDSTASGSLPTAACRSGSSDQPKVHLSGNPIKRSWTLIEPMRLPSIRGMCKKAIALPGETISELWLAPTRLPLCNYDLGDPSSENKLSRSRAP